ncbi:MBL fold metallo-hydrolase [Gordonia humi]|uniref:MBL fold metallo-hydrolase n=1 Tax=Gordonia humi TaxID=686429 RepID=UPI00360BAB08
MTRTDPIAAEQVADGLFRIPLPLPMPDLTEINSYALVDDDSLVLVDPGWRDEESEQILRTALAQIDRTPTDVSRMLITHSHWDHYTRALDWQQRYSIPVHLGREERHTIENFDLRDGSHPEQVRLLRVSGAGELADSIDSLPLEAYERDHLFGPPDHWVHDGQVLDGGAQSIVAHATPGHTRGHVVYELPGAGVMFTGDHLLPPHHSVHRFRARTGDVAADLLLAVAAGLGRGPPLVGCCPRTAPSPR